MQLKQRFLEAVIKGELGTRSEHGITVSPQQFKNYFKDINSRYVTAFLPTAVIETGQYRATHTKFLFRIRRGIYRVHPDVIAEYQTANRRVSTQCNEVTAVYITR